MLRQSDDDTVTLVAAGATVFEALAAADALAAEDIPTRVIDLYSIQPIDAATLRAAAEVTPIILTVEDHGPAGGLGEAVLSALAGGEADAGAEAGAVTDDEGDIGVFVDAIIETLAVRRKPMSGSPTELRDYEGISAAAIVRRVKELLGRRDGRPVG